MERSLSSISDWDGTTKTPLFLGGRLTTVLSCFFVVLNYFLFVGIKSIC